jgi:hypothetical protein
MTVRLLAKDREILADGVPIYVVTSNLVHTSMSSTQRAAPLYSGAPVIVQDRQLPQRIGLA